MSRGFRTTWRPLAVWLLVTCGVLAAAAALPGAWRAVHADDRAAGVADLLVALCTTGLVVALARLWAVTTSVVAEVLGGRTRSRGGATRRLVLLACGAAVVAGSSVPAVAASGEGSELLVGLALPERAVAQARHRQAPTPAPAPATHVASVRSEGYVVRAGDSLWSIAQSHPHPGISTDERWRAIWRANRSAVGADPDLIHPGQALRLPGSTPDSTDTDGDR